MTVSSFRTQCFELCSALDDWKGWTRAVFRVCDTFVTIKRAKTRHLAIRTTTFLPCIVCNIIPRIFTLTWDESKRINEPTWFPKCTHCEISRGERTIYEDFWWLNRLSFGLFQNTILPEAVHFWERALMVRETKSTIRLNRYFIYRYVSNQCMYVHLSSIAKLSIHAKLSPTRREFQILLFPFLSRREKKKINILLKPIYSN